MGKTLKGIVAALVAVVLALTGATAAQAQEKAQNTYVAYMSVTGNDNNQKIGELAAIPGTTYKGLAVPNENEQVVYCFNYPLLPPPSEKVVKLGLYGQGPTWAREFGALGKYASKPRSAKIDADVLKVIYNGFDGENDRAGIQEKFGLSDIDFRLATQQAIWYFTDSHKLETGSYGENTLKAARALAGLDSEVELKTPPSKSTLEIFKANNSKYQNLVGVKFVDEETGDPISGKSSIASSGNEVFDRCLVNAAGSPFLWLIPVGVLAGIGGQALQPYMGAIQEQIDKVNAEFAGMFQFNNDRDPIGDGGWGVERNNNQFGEFQGQLADANRQLQEALRSPQVQQAGQIAAALVGLGVAGYVIYTWCTTEPSEETKQSSAEFEVQRSKA